jgi:hypothetical protein
MGSIVNI